MNIIRVSFWISFFFIPTEVFAAGPPRQVLLIMADDLRPMLGCYGDVRLKTPNIDRLAQRGLLFERAYCQYAKCGTSRLSLMTGLRPDSIGVFSNNARDVEAFRQQRPDAVSLARHLKINGFRTQSFGKIYHDGWDTSEDWSVPSSPGRDREMWEVVDEQNPNGPTILAERLDCPVLQSPDVPDDHLFAGRMTNQVIETIKTLPQDQSSFLAVGFRRPHLPFVAPRRYFEMYSPDQSWLAPNPIPAANLPILAWFNSDGYAGSARNVGLKLPRNPSHQEAMDWNGYEMRSYNGVPNHGEIPVATQLELLQAYAACITYVDAQIGRILQALGENDRLDETLIIFCADHGWHLGEKSAWGKMTNYEVAVRVPLIAAGPGIPSGRTQSIAELVDLYPTICDSVNIPRPEHIEGESLAPIFADPTAASPGFATHQYSRYDEKYMGRAIRTDRFRFVLWREEESGNTIARELFDHTTDPNEAVNLADDPKFKSIVDELEQRLRSQFSVLANQ